MATCVLLLALAAGGPARAEATGPYRLWDQAGYRLAATSHGNWQGDLPPAAAPYAQAVRTAAQRNRIDPLLLHAVIHVESRHNPLAVSPKGAVGLMQVLPETAERFGPGHRLENVDDNLRIGARYLKFLLERYDQRIDLALAAYNAGEQAVDRHGRRIPPYAETRAYVPAVLDQYARNKAGTGIPRNYLPGTRLGRDWEKRIRDAS